ncbi:MAG: hypothetical protein RL846_06440 [Deltaproteobacteria bacterium]
MPCTNCVGRASLNGAEPLLYQQPAGCANAGGIYSANASCTTVQCGICPIQTAVIPTYFTCAGVCQSCGSAQQCTRSTIGYLLSTAIGN